MNMKSETGILVIHRNLPGTHTDEHCWCEPFIVREDDSRMPSQIIEDMDKKELKH